MPARLFLTAALSASLPGTAPGQIVRPGTITIELTAEERASPTAQLFAEAVTDAFAKVDFTPLRDPSHSRYVVHIQVKRSERGVATVAARPAAPEAFFGDWGIGVAVPLPSKKTQLRALVMTELQVEIARRDHQGPPWMARALTVQTEDSGDASAAVAQKLAAAIASRFPERSDQVISVP